MSALIRGSSPRRNGDQAGRLKFKSLGHPLLVALLIEHCHPRLTVPSDEICQEVQNPPQTLVTRLCSSRSVALSTTMMATIFNRCFIQNTKRSTWDLSGPHHRLSTEIL